MSNENVVMTATPRKQKLIETAYRLFNQYGYHATGINLILSESGVSKATLYKHFASKEALILEVLRQRHLQISASFQEKLSSCDEPCPALLIFDVLADWFHAPDFYGCNFIRASAEFALLNEPIYEYAAWHKESLKLLLIPYLPASYSDDEKSAVASQFVLLMDGAIVAAHVRGEKDAAVRAKEIAARLL